MSQIIYEEIIYLDDGTSDSFAYQIPENYNDNNEHPLLVVFHQWGGNHMSIFSTLFDEEANLRNWVLLSPYGGSSNNYNHQGAQLMVLEEIKSIQERYNIDNNKIYMVGGSMGGAAGAIFANNHLDPTEPMVAATASASGILDCERRAIEMDGNNSMTEWFGGNWTEVPFEYHRNSAIYFADTTNSMHYNLKYTPIYFDFGVTEPHRIHAEEMYDILLNYNENIWIDLNPTGSHGFSVFDESNVCDWLSQFVLNITPDYINVNLDESARAYWIEIDNPYQIENEFMKVVSSREVLENSLNINIDLAENVSYNSIILHVLDDNYDYINLNYDFNLNQTNTIGLTGEFFNYITYISVNNCDNCFYQENNIIWVNINSGNNNLEIHYPIDVNEDGIWNILDILLTINFILDQLIPTNEQSIYADINQDLEINILDIMTMVNFILTLS
mgnify:CR=1 FL=1